MPFPIALLSHPAGAYGFLVIAVAGLFYGGLGRVFVPAFTGVAAALLTALAFLHQAPNPLALSLLAVGLLLVTAEFLLPTAGAAGLTGFAANVGGSWLLLAGVEPLPLRLLLAFVGAIALAIVVARTMRRCTLPR